MYDEIVSVPGFADPFSSWTHLVAAAVALVFGVRLIFGFRGPRRYRLGLVVFVFGAVFMLSMSGVYHLLAREGTSRYVLKHLDHAGIWLMIAGSITPIHLMLFRGFARWGVLTIVWAAAINGIVLKSVFFDTFPESLGLALYLAFGWVGVFSVVAVIKRFSFRSARYLLFGGISYSAGAIIEFGNPGFVIPGVLGPHEIFHIAVIGGVIFHWRFIQHAITLANLEEPPASVAKP